jgi:hypothetical protein
MQALDEFTCGLPEQFVTCVYLEVDPARGEMTVCSAGHLPILLISPDATVGALPVPVSVPLGVGEVPHEQVRLPVHPGATLALYTDGLVETPHSDIESQLKLLTVTLQEAFASTSGLEAAAEHVLRTLLPDTRTSADDVTLLLVGFPVAPLAVVETELDCEAISVPAGRRFVDEALRSWDRAALVDTASLLVSELLTNAVCHAEGPIRLGVRHSTSELVVEITDRSPRLPRQQAGDADDEHGRGLILVDALAHSWGTRPCIDGKTVWFSLLTAPAQIW